MKNIIKIYIILLLLIFYNLTLQAQGVSYNQEFQVNTYTSSDQSNPCVSHLTDGGFVVCWQSHVQSDSQSIGQWEIHGQLFNSNGTKLNNEFKVNTYSNSSSYQIEPCISNLADSGFVVCWESWEQDGSSYGIYGQIYNSDGSKRGTEFQVNTYTNSYQSYPSVSYLKNGGFVVCWLSYGQDGSKEGIYGQLFNSDGSKRGVEFQVNTHTNDSQYLPSVNYQKDGGFVVCWQSVRQDGSD